MKLTDRAEAQWASYEAEVRARLAGRTDVDVSDVLAGIREHVEAELSRRGVERATGEDLAEVLERLGGPSQWAEPGDPRVPGPAGSTAPSAPRWPGWAALGLTLAGGVLLLLGFWWSWAPGWGLLVAGVVLARVSLDDDDPDARSAVAVGSGELEAAGTLADPTRRVALIVWWTAAAASLLALLLAPAVLTWVASQVGGPLELLLAGRPGAPGTPGTPGYWRIPLLIGGSAMAIWWLLLAGLVVRFGDAVGRILGPARTLVPVSVARALTVGAAVAILSSLIAGVLS